MFTNTKTHSRRAARHYVNALIAVVMVAAIASTGLWASDGQEPSPYPGYVEGTSNRIHYGEYSWEESIITSYVLGLKGKPKTSQVFFSAWSSLWSDQSAWYQFLYGFYLEYLMRDPRFTRDLEFEGM